MSITFGAVTNRAPMNHDHQVQRFGGTQDSVAIARQASGVQSAEGKGGAWWFSPSAMKNCARKPERRTARSVVAIEVLEYMVNLIDHRTGRRLEPSIATLMQKLNRSRDAIWKALNALRQHGFIDWLRRYVPTNREGSGPQVQQTSNAYGLCGRSSRTRC